MYIDNVVAQSPTHAAAHNNVTIEYEGKQQLILEQLILEQLITDFGLMILEKP